jgi:transcriptional regulator
MYIQNPKEKTRIEKKVAQIIKLRDKGLSFQSIADELKTASRQNIHYLYKKYKK